MPSNEQPVCWNCCHSFNTAPCFLPWSAKSDVDLYHGYGVFCSWNCVKCYAFYSSNNSLRIRPYSAIGALAFMTSHRPTHCPVYPNSHAHNCSCIQSFQGVRLPPKRENLTKFGGNMTIEEYRSGFLVIPKLDFWIGKKKLSMSYDYKIMRKIHFVDSIPSSTSKPSNVITIEPPISFVTKPFRPMSTF